MAALLKEKLKLPYFLTSSWSWCEKETLPSKELSPLHPLHPLCCLITNCWVPGRQVTRGPPLTSASGFSPSSAAPAQLGSARLSSAAGWRMISHPASRYWLGDLEAYTKARREVTDCVLQRTLSLHSTREGRQNFLAQEMETTTRAGSIWLDSLKR